MTTVIDPAGTPVPVYNRSGVTVVDVAPVLGTPSIPEPIPHFSCGTIARVTPVGSGNNPIVELPSGADIGDWVEMYSLNAFSFDVVPPAGDTIVNGSFPVSPLQSASVRKLTATEWGRTS